jgi:hypothetical protein
MMMIGRGWHAISDCRVMRISIAPECHVQRVVGQQVLSGAEKSYPRITYSPYVSRYVSNTSIDVLTTYPHTPPDYVARRGVPWHLEMMIPPAVLSSPPRAMSLASSPPTLHEFAIFAMTGKRDLRSPLRDQRPIWGDLRRHRGAHRHRSRHARIGAPSRDIPARFRDRIARMSAHRIS